VRSARCSFLGAENIFEADGNSTVDSLREAIRISILLKTVYFDYKEATLPPTRSTAPGTCPHTPHARMHTLTELPALRSCLRGRFN
jgi:hypothetical protein